MHATSLISIDFPLDSAKSADKYTFMFPVKSEATVPIALIVYTVFCTGLLTV